MPCGSAPERPLPQPATSTIAKRASSQIGKGLNSLWHWSREPLPCLLRQGVLQTSGQCTLEGFATFSILLGLQLRHPEVIKIFWRQRLFGRALLKERNGVRKFLPLKIYLCQRSC